MAEGQPSHLVLLDPRNEHRRFEDDYSAPLFIRFTDRGRCLLHVLSARSYIHLFHLFLPNSENTLIRTRVFLFQNTIFYIYCVDKATVRSMERTHNHPMFVKAFHVDDLSMYLHHAAIGHLLEQAGRQNDPDAEFQEAAHHAVQLAEELENHMIIQTGRQPEDRR